MNKRQALEEEPKARSDEPELLEKYRRTLKEDSKNTTKKKRDYKGSIEPRKDGKMKIPKYYRDKNGIVIGKTRKEKFAKKGSQYARKESYNPEIEDKEIVFWIKGRKEVTKHFYKFVGGVVE